MGILKQKAKKTKNEFCDQDVFRSDHITRENLKNALYRAFREARVGKRGTADEIKFEANLFYNLELLTDTILKQKYKPGRGIAFVVREPVVREIFAATFKDRVIHHFLYDLSYYWWDRRFIGNSFSCRIGKGTQIGWQKLREDMNSCSDMGRIPSTIYKGDLTGYFMSLDRRLLYEKVCEGLKLQFKDAPNIHAIAKYLWREVIFDDPTKGVTIRGTKRDWRKLPRSKSLFFQEPGKGIVIGNLTSQLLSNIFLDQLDRFIKIELGYKYYGRYVDDFYIIVPDSEKKNLERDRKRIEKFLLSLGLSLHPKKCYMQPVEHGVEFLGVNCYLQHAQPGERVRKNFRRTVWNTANGTKLNFDAVTSYTGLFGAMQAERELRKMFEKVGWDYGEVDLGG